MAIASTDACWLARLRWGRDSAGVPGLTIWPVAATLVATAGSARIARTSLAIRSRISIDIPLSRDSLFAQQIAISFRVQVGDGPVDSGVQGVDIGKRLVGEIEGFEVMPDHFDVVELGRVLGQPFDGEPMGAGRQCCRGGLADENRAVVEDEHDGFGGHARLGTIEVIEGHQKRNKIGAALGAGGGDDQLSLQPVERTHHGDFLRLPGCGNAQIGTPLGPGTGEIGMRQSLALVSVNQHDVAGPGLCPAQLQSQADAVDLGGDLAALQRVSRPAPAELFFRSALDSCDRPIATPSRVLISAMRRGIVQLGRSATGASSRGVMTRSAASVFTGTGPGAMLAFSASKPPRMKSLRHRRTVSSRTANASAMRRLVQPASVSSIARARSASPRSREAARVSSPSLCSALAFNGDFPAMPRPRESLRRRNHSLDPLARPSESA